jgi:hypothetical protein
MARFPCSVDQTLSPNRSKYLSVSRPSGRQRRQTTSVQLCVLYRKENQISAEMPRSVLQLWVTAHNYLRTLEPFRSAEYHPTQSSRRNERKGMEA